MKTLLITLIVIIAACGDPDTSSVSQELTACTGDDGLHIICYSTDWPGPCAQLSNCNPTGYCPESTSTEIAYCANVKNCGRPEYGNYCTGQACPNGTPQFQHWCLLGSPP